MALFDYLPQTFSTKGGQPGIKGWLSDYFKELNPYRVGHELGRAWEGQPQPTKYPPLPIPQKKQPVRPTKPKGPAWYKPGMPYQLPSNYIDTRTSGEKGQDQLKARLHDTNPLDYSWGSQIQPVPQPPEQPKRQASSSAGFADIGSALAHIQQPKMPQFNEQPPDASNPYAMANYITRHNAAVDQYHQQMAGLGEKQLSQEVGFQPIQQMLGAEAAQADVRRNELLNRYLPAQAQLGLRTGEAQLEAMPQQRAIEVMKELPMLRFAMTNPQTGELDPRYAELVNHLMETMGMPTTTAQPSEHPQAQPTEQAGFLRSALHSAVPALAGGAGWAGAAALAPETGALSFLIPAAASGLSAYLGGKAVNALDPRYANMDPNVLGMMAGGVGGFMGGRSLAKRFLPSGEGAPNVPPQASETPNVPQSIAGYLPTTERGFQHYPSPAIDVESSVEPTINQAAMRQLQDASQRRLLSYDPALMELYKKYVQQAAQ